MMDLSFVSFVKSNVFAPYTLANLGTIRYNLDARRQTPDARLTIL
jgi:hypothetical protein